MKWSKLKNIIILLLLLLNLFFLLLVGGQAQQSAGIQGEAKKTTIGLLEKNGVGLAEDVVPWSVVISPLTTERNHSGEALIAEQILGDMTKQTSGAFVEYTGENGRVGFHQDDGSFYIKLIPGAEPAATDIQAHAKKYLGQLGLAVMECDYRNEGNKAEVTLMQTEEKVPIFTCEIKMEYLYGHLVSVSGRRLLGEPAPSAEGEQALDAMTLLVQFMKEVLAEEALCSEVTAITPGYHYVTGSLSSQPKLVPVWRMETDGGALILNCLTGEIE